MQEYLTERFLFFRIILIGVIFFFVSIFCSCSGSGNKQAQISNKGTVKVFLEEPDSKLKRFSENTKFKISAITHQGKTIWGPKEYNYASSITLNEVPVTANFIITRVNLNQSLEAKTPVKVIPDKVVYITDVILNPLRDQGRDKGSTSINPGGGAGYIQTTPSTYGTSGANSMVVAYHSFSATQNLNKASKPGAPHKPYKTNTWLSPLFCADNHTQLYVGGPSYDSKAPKTLYQTPIYQIPNGVFYNMDPNMGNTGLLVGILPLLIQQDALVPSPTGGDSSTFQQTLSSFLIPSPIKIDPGFTPSRMKVNRMGDYDVEFYLRAADSPSISLDTTKVSGLLKLALVRGNPILYFTAIDIPKITLTNFATGALSNSTGSINIGGTKICYAIINGPYPQGNLSTALLYIDSQATYKPSPGTVSTLTFKSTQGPNYFVLIPLPDKTFADTTTLNSLAKAAFLYPTDTQVTYNYQASNSKVTATYKLTTTNVIGGKTTEMQAIQGLLPNHYGNFFQKGSVLITPLSSIKNGANKALEYLTVRGVLKVYSGDTFTCQYHYPGVLPYMPPLNNSDTEGNNQLSKWLKDVFIPVNKNTTPPYTGLNTGAGFDTYNAGKLMARSSIALRACEVSSNPEAQTILNSLKQGISLFFRQTPTLTQGDTKPNQSPYYSLYDSAIGTLLLYPAGLGPNKDFPSEDGTPPYDGFGTISRLNDHHFHYGYIIYTAAQIAFRDSSWANNYKGVINELIFDVANTDELNPSPAFSYPKMRFWDPYVGHCWSGAIIGPDIYQGNNEESISEEMNFWASVILWGIASNQENLTEHGINHYTVAAYSSWAYWMDELEMYQPIFNKLKGSNFANNWVGKGVSRIWGAWAQPSTFFGAHPTQEKMITFIPMTPASFYHSMSTDYISDNIKAYQSFITNFNIDPLKPKGFTSPFNNKQPFFTSLSYYSIFAKYYALVDPGNALNLFFNQEPNLNSVDNGNNNKVIPNIAMTDNGDSGAQVYHFVRYLQTHGVPNPFIYAINSPCYMVFDNNKNKQRTYVSYNTSGKTLTIIFSDGNSITDVPPGKLMTKTVILK